MQCSQCNEREAVVHLTQIAHDQVTTVHLCEKCAAEKGLDSTESAAQHPLSGLVSSIGKGVGAALPAREGEERVVCPGCGGTLRTFRETGRLGCAECYRVFEEPLRDLLRRVHGSTQHVGEGYASEASPASGEDDGVREMLQEQLRVAIEAENFELAAELRDRLKVAE